MNFSNEEPPPGNDFASRYRRTEEWIRGVTVSPTLDSEAAREAFFRHEWSIFWSETRRLGQHEQARAFLSTETRVEERAHQSMISMPERDPRPGNSIAPVMHAGSGPISTASALLNVGTGMNSTVSPVATPFESAMPMIYTGERMELSQSAVSRQPFSLPISSQVPGRLDVSGERLRLAEDSMTAVRAALSNMTISPSVTQAPQQAPPAPSVPPDLVAERSRWREAGGGNELRRSRSTGTFPCLQGCRNTFFPCNRDRTKHYRTTHRANNRFACPSCGVTWPRLNVLRRHQRNGACKKPKGRTA